MAVLTAPGGPTSLHGTSANCRVPREGYHDDSLAAVNSHFRKMAVGLSSAKHFSFG